MKKGFDINNKIALVTGANRGIGKAIIESLINHHVQKVYAAVRDLNSAKPLRNSCGDDIEPICIDLSRPETIKSAAQQAQDVDLVINNAGVLTNSSVFDQQAIESLRFEFEIKVLGLLNIAQTFAPALIKNNGAFVQVNSVASIRAVSFIATYSASKAAAYSITQSLRQELYDQGVQVLSVHPGPIATDMADEAGVAEAAESPTIVAEGIIRALKTGQFHLFPDSLAQKVEGKYKSFAENVIEKFSKE